MQAADCSPPAAVAHRTKQELNKAPGQRGAPVLAAFPHSGTRPAGLVSSLNPKTITMISPRTHGILDYIIGLLLMASPWLFGFAGAGTTPPGTAGEVEQMGGLLGITGEGIETWIPFGIGMAIIFYSLFTNYELGAIKSLPLTAHLAIDVILGIFLAASPWLFGFAEFVWLPHAIVGLLLIGTGSLTRRVTGEVPAREGMKEHPARR